MRARMAELEMTAASMREQRALAEEQRARLMAELGGASPSLMPRLPFIRRDSDDGPRFPFPFGSTSSDASVPSSPKAGRAPTPPRIEEDPSLLEELSDACHTLVV